MVRRVGYSTSSRRARRPRGAASASFRFGPWVVLLAVYAGALTACQSRPASPQAPPANPNYLQLLSVSGAPDKTHELAIAGPEGRIWYAERTPGLDLSGCAYEEAFCTKGPGDLWSVVVPLGKAESKARFKAWLQERRNQEVGIMLDGKLLLVAPTSGELHDRLWISTFSSQAEAEAQATVLRAGGQRAP